VQQPMSPDLGDQGRAPQRGPGREEQPTGPGLRDEDRGTQRGSGREEQPTGPGLRDEDRGTRRGSGREEQPTGPGLGDQGQVPPQGLEREEQPTGPGLGDQGLVPPQRLMPEREIIALTPDRLNERPRATQYRHFIRGEPRDEPIEPLTDPDLRNQGRVPRRGSGREGEIIGLTLDWLIDNTRGPQYPRHSSRGPQYPRHSSGGEPRDEPRDEYIEQYDEAFHELSSDQKFVLISDSPGSVRLTLYRH
jgi:hypothetical protein